MKITRWIFNSFTVLFILFTSCESDNDSDKLSGSWTFSEACNLNLQIGCILAKNRDFTETIEFTRNIYSIYYDDSLVTSDTYLQYQDWIIFGETDKIAKKYINRNDTLILIDTCFACYRTVYLRGKN
jgi:hypothetical protein